MRRWLWLTACPLALACASSGLVETARSGDLATLRRQIASEKASLDDGTVRDVAVAVAGREVRSAQGEAAVRRVRSIRSCAHPLVPVLRDRAGQQDDPGAEAALILVELGDLSRGSAVDRYSHATSGSWRAVAARAAIAGAHGALRRAAMRDVDERVRRAAFLAAYEAKDRADVEELLEAARVDPDPLARSQALRAAGAIGGERVVLALRDLYLRADAATRLGYLDAWAQPGSYSSGGRSQLRTVAEGGAGLLPIAAAAALYDAGEEDVLGILLRSISSGTVEERVLAMQRSPVSDADVQRALDKAAKDSDGDVASAALARLAELPARRDQAVAQLRKLAAGKPPSASARRYLAQLGDSSVAAEFARQLSDKDPATRRDAASSLIRLHRLADAAPALSDDDPGVRTAVACAVIAARD